MSTTVELRLGDLVRIDGPMTVLATGDTIVYGGPSYGTVSALDQEHPSVCVERGPEYVHVALTSADNRRARVQIRVAVKYSQITRVEEIP